MSDHRMVVLSKQCLLCGHSTNKVDFCEHCVFRKQKRVSFRLGIHRTKGALDYIHFDLGNLLVLFLEVEQIICLLLLMIIQDMLEFIF